MSMDPDRYQMRDLKRRISKMEDQIGYLKTDWKTTRMSVNDMVKEVTALKTLIRNLVDTQVK